MINQLRRHIGIQGERRLTSLGCQLAYDDEGRGTPVVCLHAAGHGARDFEPLRARLRGRVRSIAFDWPGQGASEPDVEPASAERYAAHLAAVIDGLDLERVVLLGNSIGGAAAIRYAADHPGRVHALVLANPGGLFARFPGSRSFIQLMALLFEAGARGARWFPRVFATYYKRILACEPAAEQRARIIAAGTELAPILGEAWRSFAAPTADLRAAAALVRCPVLVTWATLDPVNPLWANRAGIKRFPHAQLATFRAGHSPFLETPDEFVRTLEAFLGSLPETAQRPASSLGAG